MTTTLILGGAKSGKSRRAEALALESSLPVHYVATGPKIEGDDEWETKIKHHREHRPDSWLTVEEPLKLARLVSEYTGGSSCLLIDCLTLWLNNVLFAELDVEIEIANLCKALQAYEGELILVSNEVGLGLVPEGKLSRTFRDAQGSLNQKVAQVVDHVEFIAAGLPMILK